MEGLRRKMRGAAAGGLAALGWMAIAGMAQAEWEAPEEDRQVPNPIERTSESVEIGHKLYRENCETCHGAEGRGDGPGARVLEARLPDFTNKAWADTKTDGEWFYKISVGKDPMVGYEDFLEEDEIWHTVNFVRSLSAGLIAKSGTATAVANTMLAQADEELMAAEPTPEADTPEGAAPAVGEGEAGASEAQAEAPVEGEAHGQEAHEAVTVANPPQQENGGAGHGEDVAHGEPHPAGAESFDPKAIRNYETTGAKGPLVWALVLPVLIGGLFVAFQKMVPPPPGSEAPAGGGHGHGDDHGHGHH